MQKIVSKGAGPKIHQCQCPDCQQIGDHPNKVLHAQLNLFLSRLDEQQRRWCVALEARKLGHGGMKRLSQITGMDMNTIRRGRRELDQGLIERPVGRVRLAGGGRKPLAKNTRSRQAMVNLNEMSHQT
ncbi:MAG: hypothetical protein QNJ46_20995 [Leptolyngbyaceae cyanobacterium MO_188.B28]|nr:hypothetical protein [Leptolyngbyaceae cyanobacterium MO_188.B28]